jgi:hypothetical protein
MQRWILRRFGVKYDSVQKINAGTCMKSGMTRNISGAATANWLRCGTQNPASRLAGRLDLSSGNTDIDIAHSEENVLNWMEYLPQDCIETMIRMGWDCTT